MQKLRINDDVIILKGREKGKKGKVKSYNLSTNRVVVEGVNLVKKSVKTSEANPNGGIHEIEASIHRSNVSVVSPETGKATRVRIKNVNNKNQRESIACGSIL